MFEKRSLVLMPLQFWQKREPHEVISLIIISLSFETHFMNTYGIFDCGPQMA